MVSDTHGFVGHRVTANLGVYAEHLFKNILPDHLFTGTRLHDLSVFKSNDLIAPCRGEPYIHPPKNKRVIDIDNESQYRL